ncbi:ribonuclease Y [Hujiaoplasma nucleasis]|uniref:Ribonuclease Y n=1 Tax=Hujiaoplasma nucleasis TaxID=2725268 RepID=A0A7L6N3Y3_9MOLU|nr:ribonuclease Y [Hujiaoplasma nucleasis]QLY39765.1 ribonuclease Y [Hujiaoplasma nucleasis]
MDDTVIIIISSLLGLLIGGLVGFIIRVAMVEKGFQTAKNQSQEIIDQATLQAERIKKEKLLEAKQEIHNLNLENDKLLKEKREVVAVLENKAHQREEMAERRAANLDKREVNLDRKEENLEQKKSALEEKDLELERIIKEQNDKLYEVANLSNEQARDIILERVKDDMTKEIDMFIRDEEEKARNEAQRKAREIITGAIQKLAQDVTAETTVSVVTLPNDEMKGRIIGREGRNIRTLEAMTGVDLIIDDTPEAVVLSGFDPIRREIAKKTLEALIADGRIHPARIEEMVEKTRVEVDQFIRDKGDEAVFECGVGRVHPDLTKLIGRLHFRSSYGQNALKHSMETAFLAGKMAVELGENENLAKRAGLLHDIGKAVDHEMEGSHVDIGISIAKRHNEPLAVLDAIGSHHGDHEAQTIIGVLVAAADALSAARPGARSESLENYINRLTQLEEISSNVKGVEQAFAIQAGREVRVIVKPNEVNDERAHIVAREIKNEIEAKLSYPGTIKVTVIRETRAEDIAK